MHAASGTVCSVTFSTSVPTNTTTVNVDATVSGTGCSGLTYDWNWGDATANGTGDPTSHAYALAGTKTIALTVSNAAGTVGSSTRSVTIANPDLEPVAAVVGDACTFTANTWTMALTDASTDDNNDADALQNNLPVTTSVNWGDGSSKTFGVAGTAFSHVYKKAGTFVVSLKAVDSKVQSNTYTCVTNATPAVFSISGTVKKSVLAGGANLTYATAKLLNGTTNAVIKSVSTGTTGNFSFGSLKPGTYKITASKSGYTFPAATTIVVGPTSAGNIIQALTP
jgi:PKD repeat protein